MPTPMHVFVEIAARHGVDPKDEAAVTRFFERVGRMKPQEQQAIMDELLARDGEPAAEKA